MFFFSISTFSPCYKHHTKQSRTRGFKVFSRQHGKHQKSRSDNTTKKYQCYFNKWSKWCDYFTEVSALPAQASHVILFMVSLVQSDESFTAIESVFYAIKHFHNLGGLPDPTTSVLASYVLDAAKRICHRKRKKKTTYRDRAY